MARGSGRRAPAGLPRTSAQALGRVRGGRPRPSRAPTPRINMSRASTGFSPPASGGGGVPRTTTAMASPPRKAINKPKVGRPGNSRRARIPAGPLPTRI